MGHSRFSPNQKKLTESHPLYKKVMDLFDYMESHNIVITHEYYGLIFSDNETGLTVDLVDVEDNTGMDVFPFLEYKLLIQDS